MLYSIVNAVGTGAPQNVAVPSYISKDHITVTVSGTPTTSFSWINDATISLTAPLGAPIAVSRQTSRGARLVSYGDGTQLPGELLDIDSKQAFMLAQESFDKADATYWAGLRVADGEILNAIAGGPAARALKTLTFDSDGNPIATTPAAGTAEALAAGLVANTGADMVGFSQSAPHPSGLGKRLAATVYVSDHPFNAVGDNTTDCAAAIQAALDYAGTQVQTIIANKVNMVSARVRLGRGRFKISTTLNIPEGVTLEGESRSSSILVPTFAGVAVQMGSATREYSNVVVRNLGIIGNRSGTLAYGSWTSATSIGIYAINCIRGCAIENVFVTQCQKSIKLENSYQFKVTDSYCIYALDYHIEVDNLVSGEISGNRLDWSEKDGIFFNGVSSADETLTALVERNAIQICWRNAIRVYDVSSLTINSCFFESNYRESVDGTTHDYADINIESGPNNRGYSFVVTNNFFTHGSSSDVDAYTAIRCNRAAALVVTGNTCRDGYYWRFIDADSVDIGRIIALGNTYAGVFTKVAYNVNTTSGLIEEQDGTGVFTISELRAGGLRLMTTASSSNQGTDDKKVLYLINCAAGHRSVDLKTADCLAGRMYIVKKTDGGANNITLTTEGAETIDGAATAVSSAAYATFRVVSDGSNWFLV